MVPSGTLVRTLLESAAATAGLAVVSPVLLVGAIAIAWKDGGQVLFRQTRVGLRGRRFQLLKLRTMGKGPGSRITSEADARITSVGRILRKYKLDELPQLWNVVRGDMSLVGPRPEVPEFVDVDSPVWREVLSVRPGITDLATLVFRDEERMIPACVDPERYYREVILPVKLDLNLRYLRTRTLSSDVRVIALTLRHCVFPNGLDPDAVRRAFQCEARL